ncbi:hypothetical protein GCM10009754_84440 [Amycolatopsis minnesotensis]|uniref:Uncharacterized protein n=1 Tax=Amycolatopsis minnesotensis TaxID=337894 RepID=A0ABP5E6R6_9PSEU
MSINPEISCPPTRTKLSAHPDFSTSAGTGGGQQGDMWGQIGSGEPIDPVPLLCTVDLLGIGAVAMCGARVSCLAVAALFMVCMIFAVKPIRSSTSGRAGRAARGGRDLRVVAVGASCAIGQGGPASCVRGLKSLRVRSR